MKEIQLTQGKVALVDDGDFDYLNRFTWHLNNSGYAVNMTRRIANKQKATLMHRLIMNTPNNLQVDHIDHDGLNNQKYNLRNCTKRQNRINSKPKNKYKGAYYFERHNRFQSFITVNSNRIYLGTFKTIEEAALAYDKSAILYFGEFANLNFKKAV